MFKYLVMVIGLLISSISFGQTIDQNTLTDKYNSSDITLLLREPPMVPTKQNYFGIGEVVNGSVDDDVFTMLVAMPIMYNPKYDLTEMMTNGSKFKTGSNVKERVGIIVVLKKGKYEGVNFESIKKNRKYFIVGNYVTNSTNSEYMSFYGFAFYDASQIDDGVVKYSTNQQGQRQVEMNGATAVFRK